MNLTLEEITRVNRVQTEIYKNVAEACKKLDIKCFMVHGSLLGTVRNRGFVPFDDDIDIAIPREQYEKFINEAPALLDSRYFVQSAETDEGYPLEFAKVRDSQTTYIVDSLSHVTMNHGIYIDVFPIENASDSKWQRLKIALLSTRILSVYKDKKPTGFSARLKRFVAWLYCPSLKKAILKRSQALRKNKKSDKVTVYGGKGKERSIPWEWFSQGEMMQFEGIEAWAPKMYKEYLTHIYGDYESRTLVEGKMTEDGRVIMNASIIDTEKPYTYYLEQEER